MSWDNPVSPIDAKNSIGFLGSFLIALKQQLLDIILCFFMHLKWLWLLRFFAKML
jgi:hypothetical protein